MYKTMSGKEPLSVSERNAKPPLTTQSKNIGDNFQTENGDEEPRPNQWLPKPKQYVFTGWYRAVVVAQCANLAFYGMLYNV